MRLGADRRVEPVCFLVANEGQCLSLYAIAQLSNFNPGSANMRRGMARFHIMF